ncbi:MAG: amidohydrolase family protein [Lachnospiraceae bacterium]|nr:amidohydrolase family protein [Lachnospiraceae bacterium]
MSWSKILIKNGRIWDGSEFQDGSVRIEKGIVTEIGNASNEKVDYEFDAAGCIVCPGLVDIHMHMRGISAKDLGIQAESICFPCGVTAAADASGLEGNKELLDSFMVKNAVFVYVGIKNNKADFSNSEKMLKKYGEKAIGVKVYFDASGCDATDTLPLREICSYAHERGLKVMVHCTGAPVKMREVLACLEKGDICTHAYHGFPNTVQEDQFDALKKARNRGVIIDAAMAGGVHIDFQVIHEAVKQGAWMDTISSDVTTYSAFTRGGKYGLTMCMSIMRELGIPESEILRAVTYNAAKALGKQECWGCLKVGGNADVTVLKYGEEGFDVIDKWGNQLQSQYGYQCLLTISDGQVVYRA